jgi:SNF2 family DNA or RNA helicase
MEKIVISSQWMQFLDIIVTTFKRNFPNMKYIVITGNTTLKQCHRHIANFQKKESMQVCFMSSKAMSQGITLTAASQVYNMDIWWNGEMEYQIFS